MIEPGDGGVSYGADAYDTSMKSDCHYRAQYTELYLGFLVFTISTLTSTLHLCSEQYHWSMSLTVTQVGKILVTHCRASRNVSQKKTV